MARRRFDRFLIATIVFDFILLAVSSAFIPPLDPQLYGILALFVVSPLIAYVLVYRVMD